VVTPLICRAFRMCSYRLERRRPTSMLVHFSRTSGLDGLANVETFLGNDRGSLCSAPTGSAVRPTQKNGIAENVRPRKRPGRTCRVRLGPCATVAPCVCNIAFGPHSSPRGRLTRVDQRTHPSDSISRGRIGDLLRPARPDDRIGPGAHCPRSSKAAVNGTKRSEGPRSSRRAGDGLPRKVWCPVRAAGGRRARGCIRDAEGSLQLGPDGTWRGTTHGIGPEFVGGDHATTRRCRSADDPSACPWSAGCTNRRASSPRGARRHQACFASGKPHLHCSVLLTARCSKSPNFGRGDSLSAKPVTGCSHGCGRLAAALELASSDTEDGAARPPLRRRAKILAGD